MPRRRSLAILCTAAAAASVALATASVSRAGFSGLVLFGDSLTDVGNVHHQTFGISPQSPPYFNGRYSNGPLWAERLATGLNLPAPTASRRGGRDYAFGGTKTGPGSSSFFPFSFPNIGSQINTYLGGGAVPAPTELFVIWGGGNDFIDGQTTPQTPVNNIANHVSALASAGARQFLVPNLPPLGQLPRFRGTSDEAAMDARSAQFNDLLAPRLEQLESSLNVEIFQLDVEGLFREMLTNPSAYGFTNTTAPALVGNTPAPNPDQYVFWDDIHPTRVAHALLGAAAGESVVTHEWVSTQPGGSWHAPGNWDPAGVPAPDWIAHVINDNIPAAQAVAVGGDSSVRRVLVRGDTGPMTLIVQSVAELSVSERLDVEQQGRVSLQGGTISGAVHMAAGGALAGTGVVAGDVVNAGTVAPGEPGTVLRVAGSLTQSSAGRIEVDLGGTSAGEHDVLEIDGAAALAGTLAVRLTDNFVALPGDAFLTMTFASRTGDVAVANETGYAGLRFGKVYTDVSLTLEADARGGDANLDGVVNLADFNTLASNFGSSGANWLMADFTGDALVNLADFNVLASNFGQSVAGPDVTPQDWAALASAVPEPCAAAATVAALGAIYPRRRRDGHEARGGSVAGVQRLSGRIKSSTSTASASRYASPCGCSVSATRT